jgi:hypothetical protein
MAGAFRSINTAAGNSCLEYRADNWDPPVTGAMMMASTYRLLAGERPAADKRALVLSAHHTSLGQELRNVACRFLLTPALWTYVSGLLAGSYRDGQVVEITAPRRRLLGGAGVARERPSHGAEEDRTVPLASPRLHWRCP